MEAKDILAEVLPTFAPPPNLTGSQWADKFRVVASGPYPGKWQTKRTPYLKEPLDCITDPTVEKIVIMKPTRVGATEGIINNAIGYYMHYDPCNIIYAQTSLDEGRKYSGSILMPFIEATPVLDKLVQKDTGKKTTQTILSKKFPGGDLTIVGAKSAKGFRMVSKRIAIGDDIDGYEKNPEGDVVGLLEGRTKDYWNRKIILVSSPTTKYVSRIESAFQDSDQRYRHVPCPHCNEFQILKFGGKDFDYGIKWDNTDIWYICEHCHEKIYDYQKGDMDLKGLYKAEADFHGTAGFHINPFLCTWHPWSAFKKEFLASKSDPYKLMVFVNQYLGEVWEDKQDERVKEQDLYDRRENYTAEVPDKVKLLTCAVDVQAKHIEIEVKGWAPGEESFGIVYKIINGRFLEERTQQALDDFLLKTFKHASGFDMPIKITGIDLGGHYTSQVYDYCRAREVQNIYAVKGSNIATADVLDGPVKVKGTSKYQMVGVSACKEILYGRLKLKEVGAGYFHFPMSYDMEYFNGLMAEVPVVSKQGRRWEVIPGRKNEPVDLHSYNLAMLRLYNPDWELLQQQDYLEDRSKLVFINHDIVKHQDDSITIDPTKPLILCCSFNTLPMVWVVAQTDGRTVKVLDEIVLRNATTAQMAMVTLKKYGDHKAGFLVYGSAVGDVRTTTGKSDYAILKDYGFTKQRKKKTNPIETDVINSLNNMLENLQGVVRLKYHSRCILLGKDFKNAAFTDEGMIDQFEYGRGIASQALGWYINMDWPLKAKGLHRRNYK